MQLGGCNKIIQNYSNAPMSNSPSGLVVGSSRVWLIGLSFVLTASLLVGLASPAGAVAGYGDVPAGTWYTDAVQWSVDNGIADIAGFCFGPNTPVSRGETAVWIHNMENRPAAGERHSFADITDASQNDAISWMANTGITTGTSPTTFAPAESLTRAQVATFLHRLAGKPSAPPHGFSDVVAGWQQAGVSWMANTGITTGTSPTTFAPEDTLTRAQLVTFLYRNQNKPGVTINTSTPDCDPTAEVEPDPELTTEDSRPEPEPDPELTTEDSRPEPESTVTTTTLPPWSDIEIITPPATDDRVYGPYDPFYTQAAAVGSLHVIAGDVVDSEAVQRVAFTVAQMFANRPDLVDQMARYIYVVVGSTQSPISSLPEVRALPQWLVEEWELDLNGIISGGWGPSACVGCEGGGALPFVLVSEANAVCSGHPTDTHTTEDVVVHELAHGLHNSFEQADYEAGLALKDTFDYQVQQIYEQALADGLWEGPHYAAVNHGEYFAEIFQFWSGVNDNDAVWVDSFDLARQSAELAEYDPRAAAFLNERFGKVAVTASCHYYGD